MTRTFALLAFLCTIAIIQVHADFYPKGGDVLELDGSNINLLNEDRTGAYLVEFYAPWCESPPPPPTTHTHTQPPHAQRTHSDDPTPSKYS